MTAPRRCRRVALEGGSYCSTHQDQSELQDLLRSCMATGWEYTVDRWHQERERERLRLERQQLLSQQRQPEPQIGDPLPPYPKPWP